MIVVNIKDYLNVCNTGDLKSVREYFDSLTKSEIESIRDDHNASCLHYAARIGSVEIIQYFIMHKKVSPFIVSEIGATILHDAAVKGRIQVIDWLIKHTHLNLNVKDTNGASLMHIAAKFDQVELIDWIIQYEGIKTIKEQMYNGATCLHFACATNSVRSMKKIVQTVPSLINIQMMNGVTALYLATQENNLPIVRYLTKHGANVKLKATDGMTPFHVACQNGSSEMVSYYLDEFKVNINEKDFNGVTCLHFACINGNEKIVALLLNHGAKILADKNGSTPLHDCAADGHIECGRLLMANMCDVSIRNNQGMTALDIALAHGHKKFYDEFSRFLRNPNKDAYTIQDTSVGDGIIKLNIQDDGTSKYRRNLEKVKVSMANLGSQMTTQHNELLAIPGKENTIISPIFNSQAVVSTSTPSLGTNEQEHVAAAVQRIQNSINSSSNITSDCLEKSYESTTKCQVSSNQGLIKIVSDRDQLNKPTRNSTLIELDKCIAEFDKYKQLSDRTDSASKASILSKEKDIKSNVNQNQLDKEIVPVTPKLTEAAKPSAVIDIVKPPTLHYYHQSSLPNRPIQDIFSPVGAPPPLPPPLPSTWTSKDFLKTSLKKEIESKGAKLKHVAKETKKENKLGSSSSYNFIDELQHQIKNGGINILKNNTLKTESVNHQISRPSSTVILDSNNNLESQNENRNSFHPPDTIDQTDNNNNRNSINKLTIRQISEQRLNASNKHSSQSSQAEIPEWKRKLIEKKKQQNI